MYNLLLLPGIKVSRYFCIKVSYLYSITSVYICLCIICLSPWKIFLVIVQPFIFFYLEKIIFRRHLPFYLEVSCQRDPCFFLTKKNKKKIKNPGAKG